MAGKHKWLSPEQVQARDNAAQRDQALSQLLAVIPDVGRADLVTHEVSQFFFQVDPNYAASMLDGPKFGHRFVVPIQT